jgi:uncharacterized cupin superfamily protein
MAQVNIHSAKLAYDEGDPPGYRAAVAEVGRAAGGRELSVRLFEIPAGESLCPYHYEYVEEWLVVLEGELAMRVPSGEQSVARGDVVCFAPGPDGAHKLTNRSGAPAQILMFSSAREPSVAVYPDSDKIGVWPGREEDHVILRRADGHVGYYEGEV